MSFFLSSWSCFFVASSSCFAGASRDARSAWAAGGAAAVGGAGCWSCRSFDGDCYVEFYHCVPASSQTLEPEGRLLLRLETQFVLTMHAWTAQNGIQAAHWTLESRQPSSSFALPKRPKRL